MQTLSALVVRTEFCKKVQDAGGVKAIKEAMLDFQDKEKIIRQCFKLIKILAGNDESKVYIIQNGFTPIILRCLTINTKSPQCTFNGLGCIAALTLRSPDNSKILFDAGAPEVIIEAMKQNPDNMNVQKAGAWAVRNMVSRSRWENPKFLELGAEKILKDALKKFKEAEYDIKAALRDLGCDVDLKEEWTGKGGKLNTMQS